MSSASGAGPSWSLTTTNQNAAFVQQGSVDWAKLGELQFSASVAVLGRLAAAGIDPLTVAFGQALCTAIPIGAHGEKVLQTCLQDLKAFSSFGDVLWFGVGVRHVLRDLVKTSQGASLVALAAALTEGYSLKVSALVLYELAACSKAPSDLTPSLSQWETMAKASSSTFTSSTFGLRISQITRLARSCIGPDKARKNHPLGHPTDLAQVILGIGRVIMCTVETIDFNGGVATSWIVAWADFVLGLRVEMHTSEGNLIYSNFDRESLQPQVRVVLNTNDSNCARSIYQTGQTTTIRSGKDFIKDCFIYDQSEARSIIHEHNNFRGRVDWEDILETMFGVGFEDFLRANAKFSPNLCVCPQISAPINIFSGYLVTLSALAFHRTLLQHLFHDLTSFWDWILHVFPELRPIKPQLHLYARNAHPASYQEMQSDHFRCSARISELCGCRSRNPWANVCLNYFSKSVFSLLLIRSRLVFDSPMWPTYSGLLSLFGSGGGITDCPETLPIFTDTFDLINRTKDYYETTLRLFAMVPISRPVANLCSAKSDGKIYAYLETLKELTDDVGKANIVHIGSGSIQCNARYYDGVFERPCFSQPSYAAEAVIESTDVKELERDTTQTGLVLKARVEAAASSLYFCYQITSPRGIITVGSAQLAQNLIASVEYRFDFAYGKARRLDGLTDQASAEANQNWLKSHGFLVIDGEGDTTPLKAGLIVRPLRGNTLGHCIVISRMRDIQKAPSSRGYDHEPRVHLVKTRDHLDQLLNWLRYNSKSGEDPRDTIVS